MVWTATDVGVERSRARWPELPLAAWHDTAETVHRWMQVIGKIQLALTPTVNHWWNVAFEVTARGMATGLLPYGDRWFDLEFDFVDHYLHVRTSDGATRSVRLGARSVASFYDEVMDVLRGQGIDVEIWPVPVEIDDPIRLDRDDRHRAYDIPYVIRFWRIVARTAMVLERFRARFLGKASRPLFWWGTFDITASRFSGRPAPGSERLGPIERVAYSHELFSTGWWPGDSRLAEPAYYAFISPEPAGFGDEPLPIEGAFYDAKLRGFYLPYARVRLSTAPDAQLLDFFQLAYERAATLARWDRAALERAI